MRGGQLDRRIQLQRRSVTKDEQGQDVESFSTYARAWAQRKDIRGREFVASQQPIAENSANFILRWRPDILMTDRLIDGDVVYNIRQLAEVGRQKSIELLATAVVP